MPGHAIDGRAPRRLNPKKPWRPAFRSGPAPAPSAAELVYADAKARAPDAAIGYGITRGGPWARVGDVRIRAATPQRALAEALAKHLEGKTT